MLDMFEGDGASRAPGDLPLGAAKMLGSEFLAVRVQGF